MNESDNIQPRLNQFYPHILVKYNGSYWHSRPELVNELSNYFNYHYYCCVKSQSEIDTDKYKKLSKKITVHDFFDNISRREYIRNYRKYDYRIKNDCNMDSDLFLINYPFRKTSMILAHQLRNTNLIIWVLSDYVGQFGVHDQGTLKDTIKQVAKPFVSIVYPSITKKLFNDNLIIYTGEKLYNKKNNINQHEFTEVHSLNKDSERIQNSFCNEVAFIGRENKQKGIDLAIKAVNEYDSNLTLNVIGMEKLTKFTDLNVDEIQFHGEVYDDTKFFDLLCKNDFLLMPSVAEKQGKVQLEAMSAGVVPICSDSGGIPFTVEHNYNGLLFEERSLTGLINCLRKGYSSPTLYKRLVEGGLDTTSKIDVATQGKKLASIIKNHYLEGTV